MYQHTVSAVPSLQVPAFLWFGFPGPAAQLGSEKLALSVPHFIVYSIPCFVKPHVQSLPRLHKTHILQYLRRSMTQQPQVKHANRTRAQPGLRVCQTELTGKGNNLTTFYTGTPSRRASLLPIPNTLLKQAQSLSKSTNLQTLCDDYNCAPRQIAPLQTYNSEDCFKP